MVASLLLGRVASRLGTIGELARLPDDIGCFQGTLGKQNFAAWPSVELPAGWIPKRKTDYVKLRLALGLAGRFDVSAFVSALSGGALFSAAFVSTLSRPVLLGAACHQG
jgi:hypothetical protein